MVSPYDLSRQGDMMGGVLLVIAVSLAINWIALYFVIRAAVTSARRRTTHASHTSERPKG